MYSQILAAILKNVRHFNHRVLRGCIHIQYWSVVAPLIIIIYIMTQSLLSSSWYHIYVASRTCVGAPGTPD